MTSRDSPRNGLGSTFERRSRLGSLGEDAAAAELVRFGCRVLARNYRCRGGEADLIVEETTPDGETLAFVEVKTRSSLRHGLPQEAVDWTKQQRLGKAAAHYCHRQAIMDRPIRFDVVEVVVLAGEVAAVRVIRNAFVPEE